MQLICSICQLPIKSLIIDKDLALTEVSNKLTKHLIDKHPANTLQLQQEISDINSLMVWYMLMQCYALIPENEEYVKQKFDEHQTKLAALLNLGEVVEDDKGIAEKPKVII